jgi:Family of unknown function (DUF6328)
MARRGKDRLPAGEDVRHAINQRPLDIKYNRSEHALKFQLRSRPRSGRAIQERRRRLHVPRAMKVAAKLKIALDETRMLILGAQVLLGFQMRSVFQDAFEQLPVHARIWDGVALLIMVAVLGLLIAPAAHHRVVEQGNATRYIMKVISWAMSGALLLFSVALGVNIFIAVERIAGLAAAVVAGIAAAALALGFWFGIEWAVLLRNGGKEVDMKDQQISLDKKIDQMLTEGRVILPGAQALLGFQLAVILTEAFDKLPGASKATHALALGLVALSTILLMTPAAYHRIVYGGEESDEFLRLGSGFVMAATVALALGLTADVYVVIGKIAGSQTTGMVAAAVSLAALLGLWHVSPLYVRAQREGASARSAAGLSVRR